MKILAIGDFHGKFPVRLQSTIKKEKPSLIISVGDYCPFTNRDLFFKHAYFSEKQLWEFIGKKKVKQGILRDLELGESVLKKLNKQKIPVLSVIGNIDYTHLHDTFDLNSSSGKGKIWKWENQNFFSKVIKKYKNIQRFDYKSKKINNLIFIGSYGHTYSGEVKSKNFKKYHTILKKLFHKFRKENKNNQVIFVGHNMPYDCKLDKIKNKKAHSLVKNQHFGAKLIRRVIDKYQPVLYLGGHMHENQGKCKIGKTLVVNPGAAVEGNFAIIDFDSTIGKIKNIKFIK